VSAFIVTSFADIQIKAMEQEDRYCRTCRAVTQQRNGRQAHIPPAWDCTTCWTRHYTA